MEGQVLVLQQNADGTETAVVKMSAAPRRMAGVSFKNVERSMNLVSKYVNVKDWQNALKAKKALYGYVEGCQKMQVVDEETGETKMKDAIVINGFFSEDGDLPKGEMEELHIVGQYKAVQTLKEFPVGTAVVITYIGAEQFGKKNIHQFTVNELFV